MRENEGLAWDARVAAGLAVVSAAFLFVGLGSGSVVNADEAIYHGIAERMVATGDFFTLDFRGEPRVYDTFMNAPLHYWLRAGLIAVGGSNEWTMRLVSALAAWLCVLATYAFGCRIVGRRAGLVGAGMLLSTFQFVYLHGARTGELDTLVSLWLVLCAWTFLRGVEDSKGFALHHAAVAGLLFTKAPLVLVVVAAELAWFVAHAPARSELTRYLRTGALALPLAASWHVGQAVVHADRVGEIAARMAGQAASGDPESGRLGLVGNTLFYARTLLYGGFPYSLLFPFALLPLFRRNGPASQGLALAFAIAVLGFFVVVGKHFPWYVMPAYPFLVLLAARWLVLLCERGFETPGAAGVAFVWAALLGLDARPLDTHPFAMRALEFPMQLVPRFGDGAASVLGIGILGLVGAAALHALGRERLRGPGLAVALGLALVGTAVLRVAAPLRHLDHTSRLAGTHAALAAKRDRGEAVGYPIRLERPELQIARFYFGEDYELVPETDAQGTDLALYPAGDPRVIERSIGRRGLERRLPAR